VPEQQYVIARWRVSIASVCVNYWSGRSVSVKASKKFTKITGTASLF